MKGEKKEYQNKKRLYLLGLCGVLAVSGTIYAITRKSEPQAEPKELVDLNDEGQQVPDGTQNFAQNDPVTSDPVLPTSEPENKAQDEPGSVGYTASGQAPEGPSEQQLTASGEVGINKPGLQNHAEPTTAPVSDTKTASNEPGGMAGTSGNTDGKTVKSDKNTGSTEEKIAKSNEGSTGKTSDGKAAQPQETAQVNSPTAKDLQFSEEDGLSWPLSGNVVKNYSADKLIYFETLGQFKINPGIFIAGEKGSAIVAAADGIVKEIKKEDKTGQTLILDIGNGYTLTYGQLEEIAVKTGDYVKDGQELAKLAKVTKYYRLEGEHLYFQVQKDGQNVNPLTLIRAE